MEGSLETTNILLGVMAAISVLEGLLIIGIAIAGWKVYRQMSGVIEGLESRHIAPAMVRVNEILDQVNAVASTVRNDTDRVEQAIRHTINRVDGTAHRVRDDVRARASWVVGTIRGVRAVIENMLRADSRSRNTTDYARTH